MPDLPRLRPARPQDRAALFDICLRTADSGGDATALYSDPDFPGLVWSVPYLDFAPAHCFVIEFGGNAMGYIVGTPDTRAFEHALERNWWPALRARYAGYVAAARLDDNVLSFIETPRGPPAVLLDRFPAHLHINLLPPLQAGGWGRKLIEAELDSLRRAGAPGVHLGVGRTNHRAIGFYRHLGFTDIVTEGGGIWMGQQLGG